MSEINPEEVEVFPWSEQLETHVQTIDEQHRVLVKLLNQLASYLTVETKKIQLETVFNELVDYAQYHFKTEEAIWQPCFEGDNWLQEHKKSHDSFLSQITSLQHQRASITIEEAVEDVVKFLISWLAYHILDSDKRMAIALHAVEGGVSTAEAKVVADKEMSGSTRLFIEAILKMYEQMSVRTLALLKEKTERQRLEAELLRFNEQLEQQVAERTQELIEANQSKDEFLASMSHELRTPLASIIGNCEYLQEKEEDSEKLNVLQTIGAAGKSQVALVNDILDMSKIQSGKFSIDEFSYDLSEVLQNIEKMVSVRARDAGLELVFKRESTENFLLLGDANRISQILINLLTNAIKFTSSGSVRLTCWNSAKQLHFKVEDSGIGMSADTLKRVFNAFEQADGSISSRFGGTGLGLYISLNLAEMMGGMIDVSSEEGVGSIFQLTIPYKPSSTPAAAIEENHKDQLQHNEMYVGHVLIAEDTPELQLLERRILERVGVTVEIANDGVEAVELAEQHSFDLILMDMQMPKMDGIEATQVLRERNITTPVVALTANVMQKHRDLFSQAGCDGFLSKPIDRQELHSILGKYLMLRKDRQMLDSLKIENRRKVNRRSEEIATIEDDRTTPRRLQDRQNQAVRQLSPAVDGYIDDELQRLFISRVGQLNSELCEAYDAENWSEVRKIALMVKGSAESFGFPKLTQLGREVCKTIDLKQTASIPEVTKALIEGLSENQP